MPLSLFCPTTKTAIEKRIADSKLLLADIADLQRTNFIRKLDDRIRDFEIELSNDSLSPVEKEHVLKQYNRFSNVLHRCLKSPHQAESVITSYLYRQYYPVGIHDVTKPNPSNYYFANAGVILGSLLLLSAIAAFPLYPIVASVLLATACTVLFPSCFYLLIPDSPDTTSKKAQEKQLFEEGAQLIDPSVTFSAPENDIYIIDPMYDNPMFMTH